MEHHVFKLSKHVVKQIRDAEVLNGHIFIDWLGNVQVLDLYALLVIFILSS